MGDIDGRSDVPPERPPAGMSPSCRFCLELEPISGPGHILIIRLHGVCNLTSIQAFTHTLNVLLASGFTRIVLDLADLRSLEPGGAGALRRIALRARALGGAVTILCPPSYFHGRADVMDRLGTVPVLALEEEAVSLLRPSSVSGPPETEPVPPE